jgi:hypothetical protein
VHGKGNLEVDQSAGRIRTRRMASTSPDHQDGLR